MFGTTTTDSNTIDRDTLERAHELALLENENRRLLAQLREANSRALTEQRKLESFKGQVSEVATKYAKANDWCGEVNEALAELGLKPVASTYTASVTVTFEISFESDDEPSSYDVEHALEAELSSWSLDEFEVTSVSIDVDNVDAD